MLKFILNHEVVAPTLPAGTLLLDFVRYHQHLTGTKIGCREGDCGACTVMVGELCNSRVAYHTATSCLMPLGNAAGKHIVTIEGLNVAGLNAIQEAFVAEGATQCGFCTPGFIVSAASFCLSNSEATHQHAIDAVNGNICRCTGYKSIERALEAIQQKLQNRRQEDAIDFATQNNFVPAYFSLIPQLLSQLKGETTFRPDVKPSQQKLGGGTDLYVQQHEQMLHNEISFLLEDESIRTISAQDGVCTVGGAATAAQLAGSPIFKMHFKELDQYIQLISSTQIRNMATVAGNICNASPIGDFSIFFLALNAQLHLRKEEQNRVVPLRNFYKGYKKIDMLPGEVLANISFRLTDEQSFFNFEKVSKRTNLDIASVNTAIHLTMQGTVVKEASIAAGGVAPVPFYFPLASNFLKGKEPSNAMINKLCSIMQGEITPISDVRGSADYKRLLLQQLVKAHFVKLLNAFDGAMIS